MIVLKFLDGILRKLYRHAQSGIHSVVHNIVEQVVLDLLREEFTGDILDTQNAMYLNTNAAANSLLKKLLASTSFLAPVGKFVRQKTDSPLQIRVK